MFYFISYQVDGGQHLKRFNTLDEYFSWLQAYHDEHGQYPYKLVAFEAKCVFDGS